MTTPNHIVLARGGTMCRRLNFPNCAQLQKNYFFLAWSSSKKHLHDTFSPLDLIHLLIKLDGTCAYLLQKKMNYIILAGGVTLFDLLYYFSWTQHQMNSSLMFWTLLRSWPIFIEMSLHKPDFEVNPFPTLYPTMDCEQTHAYFCVEWGFPYVDNCKKVNISNFGKNMPTFFRMIWTLFIELYNTNVANCLR